MKINNILNFKTILIFLSIFGILIFRLFSIPLFDPPDEQSHYAQVHFFVTEGSMPNLSNKNNLSEEEIFAERIIGTMSEGENRYSYHPEYRYELVDGTVGKYEYELKTYNTNEYRSKYLISQSSTYPPLYYWVTSLFYSLVDNKDLMVRLYVSRFSSLLFTLFIPVIAYYFAMLIWGKGILARTLPFLVLFFPMTTYLGVSINSDNLHFLLFGIALFLMIKLIKEGFSNSLSISIGTIIGLDLITKPQAYALFPILVLAILIRFRFDEWRVWLRQLPYLFVPILVIAGWQEVPKLLFGSDSVSSTAYLAREVNFGGWNRFIIFGKEYLRSNLAEVIVWYWGVFKWSGIILPRFFWWVANRLLVVALAGIALHMIRDIRTMRFGFTSRIMLFSIMSNLIYLFAIFMFDWQFYQEYGRSLGLQARYYQPLLITQMFLLLSGLIEFTHNRKIHNWICYILIFLFLTMHLTSVYILLMSYYDIYPLKTLINQISQYKPIFAKGNWWYLWFSAYFGGIITTTIITIKGYSSK